MKKLTTKTLRKGFCPICLQLYRDYEAEVKRQYLARKKARNIPVDK